LSVERGPAIVEVAVGGVYSSSDSKFRSRLMGFLDTICYRKKENYENDRDNEK
jgi:hypothetical protein